MANLMDINASLEDPIQSFDYLMSLFDGTLPPPPLGKGPFVATSDVVEDIPVFGSPAALAAVTIVPTMPALAPKTPSADALRPKPKPKYFPPPLWR